MLAEGDTERQVEKRPNLTTSRNAEGQKVLPPPASDCHSVPEWLSSPSRIGNNRHIPREKAGVGMKATQQTNDSLSDPQEVA
jgi:hypothetical protein